MDTVILPPNPHRPGCAVELLERIFEQVLDHEEKDNHTGLQPILHMMTTFAQRKWYEKFYQVVRIRSKHALVGLNRTMLARETISDPLDVFVKKLCLELPHAHAAPPYYQPHPMAKHDPRECVSVEQPLTPTDTIGIFQLLLRCAPYLNTLVVHGGCPFPDLLYPFRRLRFHVLTDADLPMYLISQRVPNPSILERMVFDEEGSTDLLRSVFWDDHIEGSEANWLPLMSDAGSPMDQWTLNRNWHTLKRLRVAVGTPQSMALPLERLDFRYLSALTDLYISFTGYDQQDVRLNLTSLKVSTMTEVVGIECDHGELAVSYTDLMCARIHPKVTFVSLCQLEEVCGFAPDLITPYHQDRFDNVVMDFNFVGLGVCWSDALRSKMEEKRNVLVEYHFIHKADTFLISLT
ncbi:hypothetical protein VNI00_006165 [Paramarasmius palmivorus]|uniref:Uncharacterized protein n=1 Tax=Paramarasmius palmivorus TaxID=297713 RepID=A0AAW0D8H6_9AGAR